MIIKTRSKCCNKVYELIWDDNSMEAWADDYEEDNVVEDLDECEDDPAFCPFCGTHIDYDE